MGKLRQFRNKFPQYNDLSDEELAVLIHRKNYPDLSFESFAQDIGLRSKEQKLEKDLIALRPSPKNSVQPYEIQRLKSKKLNKDKKKGDIIFWKDLV